MNVSDDYGDGSWAVDSGQRELMRRAGYSPSRYLQRWWVSPAVALFEGRLGRLPATNDTRLYFPEMARIERGPGHRDWEARPHGARVRALTRWDAVVALLALESPDDTELVALASVLYASGRVEPWHAAPKAEP